MNKSSQPTPHMGLRFEALNEMNEDFIDTETAGLLIEHTEGVTKQGEVGGGVQLLRRVDKGGDRAGSTSKECAEILSVAAKGKVVEVPSILPAARHTVVNVVDGDGGRVTHGTKGRVLPASIRGLQSHGGSKVQIGNQGGAKIGNKTRKKDKGVKQPALRDRLSPLMRDLDEAVVAAAERARDTGGTDNASNSEVEWLPNSTFEQPSDTDMQV
ncbi:hypothetical protein V6N13_018741 [Hibiscus sabdariffa]